MEPSEEGEAVEDAADPPPRVLRPGDLLEALAGLAPDAVASVRVPVRAKTGIGKAMGPPKLEAKLALVESDQLALTLEDLSLRFAGRPPRLQEGDEVEEDSSPVDPQAAFHSQMPNALALGNFLQAEKSAFSGANWNWVLKSLPSDKLKVLDSDRRMLGGQSQAQFLRMTDKSLQQFEETARRALLAVSAIDSFSGGLARAICAPVEEGAAFRLRDQMDPDDVEAMLVGIRIALEDVYKHLAGLYGNPILARRELLLLFASDKLSDQDKRVLRSQPICAGSLFGNAAASVVHDAAQRAKDDDALRTRTRPQGGGGGGASGGGAHDGKPSQSHKRKRSQNVRSTHKENPKPQQAAGGKGPPKLQKQKAAGGGSKKQPPP